MCLLHVVDTNERAMQLRLIASSASAGQSWNLRCLLREGLIDFIRRTQPRALPRLRTELHDARSAPGVDDGAAAPRQAGDERDALLDERPGMADLTAPTGGVEPLQPSKQAPHPPGSAKR